MTAESASDPDPAAPGGARPSPPRNIGHYRILEQIDRGGMGEVFIGERADGLFDHRVAIKRISTRLAPAAAQELFETERQALAQLSHRNIAQLFDGGVDESGSPFLIMELVNGLPLDRYAAQNKLSPRQIVALIIAVCEGVQHAHQHLIVHAGLNPANILVDESGAPRIVDFGVARVLREAEAETSAPLPQTPAYASPQRLKGSPPTIQDDVYSLGAILRELLAGATRRSHEREAIIVRACADDPASRYPSVQELANDLRAWSEHRPLASRRGQALHAFGKYLRRHRLAAITTAIAVAGLTGALAFSTSLYLSAERDRVQAEHRFSEVRSLSRYLLFDVYDRLDKTPHALAMRLDVADIAQGYLAQLSQAASAPADVKREVVEGLIRLAALQAGRAHSNLGRPEAAKTNLDRADALLADLTRNEMPVAEDRYRRIQINLLRASISMNADQALGDADKFLAAARDELAHLPPPGAPPDLVVEAAMSGAELANWHGTYDDALSQATATLTLIDALPPAQRQSDEFRNAEIRARTLKGDALYYLEHEPEAAVEYHENIRRSDAWLAEQPDSMLARRQAIFARWSLGTTIMETDAAGSLKELDAASLLVPRLLEFEPADENTLRLESVVLLARAQALVANGRFAEGLAAVQQQVANRRARYEANPGTPEYARAYAVILTAKGDLLAENKRVTEGCSAYADADRIFTELQQRDRVSTFDSSNGGLAQLQTAMKKYCPTSN